MTSSDREETKGMIMIPMTSPAARALSEETSRPRNTPASRIRGATTRAAKKPYTTVGIPARISISGLAAERNRRSAYSERKIADIRPMGTATSMAMPDIRSVPTNTGTDPNAPEEPIWSARIAIWGLHFNPNRNSHTGIFWKNRMASYKTDRTMPIVVNMAMVEQKIRMTVVIFST